MTTDALRKAQSLIIPTNFIPYCVGDRVWLEGRNLNTTHPSAKLAPRRYGPFLVTAVISRTSYRLKLPTSWKIHNVFHASLLTPYRETSMNGNQYQEPVPDLIDGQPEWEVERILGARKRRHQLQYLVRWKGFSEAHDSWEPLSHINADQLIQDFYRQSPEAVRTTEVKNPIDQTPLITVRCITMSTTTTPPLATPSTPLIERIDLTGDAPTAPPSPAPSENTMDLPR